MLKCIDYARRLDHNINDVVKCIDLLNILRNKKEKKNCHMFYCSLYELYVSFSYF